MTCSFSIVIPAYSSSQTIGILCNEIFAQDPDAVVIIVDDNSPNGTGMIAEAIAASHTMVKVIHRAIIPDFHIMPHEH
jgi:dolichol-phosphate mannosyltransferase